MSDDLDMPVTIWAEPDGGDTTIHNGDPKLEALIATGYLYEYTRADIPKARIEELETENKRLREALVNACDLIDDLYDKKPGLKEVTVYRTLASALQEKEE